MWCWNKHYVSDEFLNEVSFIWLDQSSSVYWKKVKTLSRVRLFATPWTVANQAPPSMGFSRQEYWSGFLFPSPGDLPDPGIEPRSPAFQADALSSEHQGSQCLLVWHLVSRLCFQPCQLLSAGSFGLSPYMWSQALSQFPSLCCSNLYILGVSMALN